jgi:hypothetical protein
VSRSALHRRPKVGGIDRENPAFRGVPSSTRDEHPTAWMPQPVRSVAVSSDIPFVDGPIVSTVTQTRAASTAEPARTPTAPKALSSARPANDSAVTAPRPTA